MDVTRIAELIEEQGVKVTTCKVTKGSEIIDGLSLGTSKARPTFYPCNFNGTDEEIAKQIIAKYNELPATPDFVEQLKDLKALKDKLYAAVRKPVNDAAVKFKFLDLEVVLRINLTEEATAIVNEGLLAEMGINMYEAFRLAKDNANYQIESMDNIFAELMGGNSEASNLYVISNAQKYYGAGALLHTEIFEQLACELDNDLYIIPSSIHELIALPACDKSAKERNYFNSMVKDVNATVVAPTEVLSDHVYYYQKGSFEITY